MRLDKERPLDFFKLKKWSFYYAATKVTTTPLNADIRAAERKPLS
jgi:hypothetical protein